MKERVNIDDLESIGDAEFYKGKPFTGILYELFPDGTLHYEEEHNNGFPCGYRKIWWRNGNKKLEIIYPNSKEATGKQTEWYENGSLKEFTEESTHGIVHAKKWDINGNLIEEC